MDLDKDVLDGHLLPIEEILSATIVKDTVFVEDVEETAQAEE